MKHARKLSFILSALLQCLPIARTFFVAPMAGMPAIAIIFRWAVGATALLGGVDAVSGASTTIASPITATGTNGVAFSYRITTGPEVANTFAAAPLPVGLAVSTSSGKITGTPTQVGITICQLTASDSNNPSRTVHTNLTITIVSGTTATVPSITTQPASKTVTTGGSVTFSVVAGGTAPLAYQWKFNGSAISGATATSYTISSVQSANAGSYTVTVTNSAGAVTSSAATLTVNPTVSAPVITTQPASKTVTAGGSVTFSVVASGTAPLTYQWRFNGANISGATSPSYTINNCQAANAGTYSVIVSNSAGTATSANATLTVNAVAVAPAITTQPVSKTVSAGGSATFSVVATGTAPLVYQWKFNGAAISGATATSYTINNCQSANAGSYTVTVTNSAGSVTSSVATLTVNATVTAPSITTQPASMSVTAGSSASFAVAATGSTPLFYQWRFNSTKITGATTPTYTMSNVQSNNAGGYSVIVSNSVSSVTSATATLTVTANSGGGGGHDDDDDDTEKAKLTVKITGSGSVTPNYNGKELEIGKKYSVTAEPASGFAFKNWSGSVSSTNKTLTFTMKANMVLQANFVGSAFSAVRGEYNGLFYEPAGVAWDTAGFLSADVTDTGTIKAELLRGGERHKFKGQFDAAGRATVTIARGSSPALTVKLQLDLAKGTDSLTGSVADGSAIAELTADRARNDVKAKSKIAGGHYALRLTRTDRTPSATGKIELKSDGSVAFAGKLADGTELEQEVPLSKNGEWPLHAVLPDNRGLLIGWITFSGSKTPSATGSVILARPTGATEELSVEIAGESDDDEEED